MLSLVVEDDFTSRLILQKVLRDYGEVHLAANGAEAVAAFRDARVCGVPYDLVCLDIMLPGLSGQEVLAAIRATEQADFVVSKTAKVVMVTAADDKSNVLTAFREQCDAYLVKPVETRLLRQQLSQLGIDPMPFAG